jgi:hypothetical protein
VLNLGSGAVGISTYGVPTVAGLKAELLAARQKEEGLLRSHFGEGRM